MADAQVEYKRVDLQSYEARNGESLAQSFKYNFSFPSMYRRLKLTRNRSVTSESKFDITNLKREPAMHRKSKWCRDSRQINPCCSQRHGPIGD